MAKAKGIQAHKVFKLGKGAAKRDDRNLKLATVLRKAAPTLPSSYDFDTNDGTHFSALYSFTAGGDNTLGNQPHHNAMLLHGSMLIGAALYGGTTMNGGTGKGVIFSINEDGSQFGIVHSFHGKPDDGEKPFGSLVEVDGWLYGTSTEGGATGDGTLFRLHVSDGKYEVLASFDRATTGAFPEDNVTLGADGATLYGLTQAGGANDPDATNYYGTVFSWAIPAS